MTTKNKIITYIICVFILTLIFYSAVSLIFWDFNFINSHPIITRIMFIISCWIIFTNVQFFDTENQKDSWLYNKFFKQEIVRKTGIELIAEEREKQIKKGRSVENDYRYNNNQQLSSCARFLCHNSLFDEEDAKETLIQIGKVQLENWDLDFFDNMMRRDYGERLIIAGALICAEIDRLSFEKANNKNGIDKIKELTNMCNEEFKTSFGKELQNASKNLTRE